MVLVAPSPVPVDLNIVKLYQAKDCLIGNLPVLVFYGPSTTTNNTQNNSRIQAHILSIAGYVSFPRLTVSPTSPPYAAVNHLPDDKQGDEVYRGFAFSLMKYYAELPSKVKQCLVDMVAIGRPNEVVPPMFDEAHAATMAANMSLVENASDIAAHVFTSLAEKSLSWTDVDVMLPHNSIKKIDPGDPPGNLEGNFDYIDDGPIIDYGEFKQIVETFGNPSFMPTSRIKRAPSQPTNTARTRVLAQGQKEALQREMREILETEKRYVMKVADLLKSPAMQHYRSSKNNTYQFNSHGEKTMQQLFPPSLNAIFKVNTELLNALRALMNDFSPEEQGARKSDIPWVYDRDRTGSDSFAKVLLQYIPAFKEPYKEYLRASSQFPKILAEISRDKDSNFAKAIQQTGEQRFRSWLIEPVQRLPRYSLYIDNMIKQLPASHRAVRKLLKAKDMITDICALDDDVTSDNSLIIQRLKSLTKDWPSALQPSGRLITVVDVAEYQTPYQVEQDNKESTQCIFLLFSDYLLVLKKPARNSVSARGLQADLDRPASAPSTITLGDAGTIQQEKLSVMFSFRLHETRFTESNEGQLVSLTHTQKTLKSHHTSDNTSNFTTTTKTYYLQGPYEGKAARWNEEVARARIADRFPEQMRESEKWGFRILSPHMPHRENLGIVSAIFEDDSHAIKEHKRKYGARIQVFVHGIGEEDKPFEEGTTAEIAARVLVLGGDMYRLDFKGFQGHYSTDNISAEDFDAVFVKRLSNLQRLHNQPITLELALAQISSYQQIIEATSQKLPLQRSDSRGRTWGPLSPVKAISNFFGRRRSGSGGKRSSRGSSGEVSLNGDDIPTAADPTLSRNASTSQGNNDQSKRKVTHSSTNSIGSSRRRRFGLGVLTRENSKSEPESKVAQVLRSLSKKSSADGNSQPSSLSKAFLSRSRSTDNDSRKPILSRPSSQDRPDSSGSSQLDTRSRPGSSHNAVSNLLTIDEKHPQPARSNLRKKRRSSLSDLQELKNTASSFGVPPPRTHYVPDASVAPFKAARQALRTPLPSKVQRLPAEVTTTRLPSPSRKENISPEALAQGNLNQNNTHTDDRLQPLSSKKNNVLSPTSNVPKLKYGLRDRSAPSNIPTLSPTKDGAQGPRKLKMQSPKKLRERLDKEKEAMRELQPVLQDELDAIGHELDDLSLTREGHSVAKHLSARVQALENKTSQHMDVLSERWHAMRKDVDSSIMVADKKSRNLDELYREANAENEMLYERFNDELEKIAVKAMKGDGAGAIVEELKKAQAEAARLRKENQRLRRENVGLKSQLAGI